MQIRSLFTVILLFCLWSARSQNVAINNDGSSADPSAILDIKSDSKGILVPRMSFSNRVLLSNPATGLLVYQTDEYPDFQSGFYYNAGTPAQPNWKRVGDGEKEVIDVFEANGSFTVPAGVQKIYFEAVSGGGGRGGRSNFNSGTSLWYFGGAGGGGGFVKGFIRVSPGQTINVTVGQPGANGTDGASPTNGTAGGSTSVSIGAANVMTVSGGAGGLAAGASTSGIGGNGGSLSAFDGIYTILQRFLPGLAGQGGAIFANLSGASDYGASGFAPVLGEYNYLTLQRARLLETSVSLVSGPNFGRGGGSSPSVGGYVIFSY